MDAVRVDAPDRKAIVQALRDLADRLEDGHGKYASPQLTAFHQVVEEPLPHVRSFEIPNPWPTRKIPCTGYVLLLGEETTSTWLINLLQKEIWHKVEEPKPPAPPFELSSYTLTQLETSRYLQRGIN